MTGAVQKKLLPGLLAVLGFALSPLSWWNDLFVNVPLAYLIALPFSLISDRLLLPAIIAGYWLTNIAGLVLLHIGARELAGGTATAHWKRDIAISLIYTAAITVMVLAGFLKAPWHYGSGMH